jgi:hypothetical protein
VDYHGPATGLSLYCKEIAFAVKAAARGIQPQAANNPIVSAAFDDRFANGAMLPGKDIRI